MGWFNQLELDSLDQLLLIQLQDLYDAENRLVAALPKMGEGAYCRELSEALMQHLEETKGHVGRLEQIFDRLSVTPQRLPCDAMKGLIAEGGEILSASGNPYVKDAAIISAAQRIEHYEIAAYGSVRNWAEQLGHVDIAEVLQETLDEEGNANKILTEIAEQPINTESTTHG